MELGSAWDATTCINQYFKSISGICNIWYHVYKNSCWTLSSPYFIIQTWLQIHVIKGYQLVSHSVICVNLFLEEGGHLIGTNTPRHVMMWRELFIPHPYPDSAKRFKRKIWLTAGLMLCQRQRRWYSINPAVFLVFFDFGCLQYFLRGQLSSLLCHLFDLIDMGLLSPHYFHTNENTVQGILLYPFIN